MTRGSAEPGSRTGRSPRRAPARVRQYSPALDREVNPSGPASMLIIENENTLLEPIAQARRESRGATRRERPGARGRYVRILEERRVFTGRETELVRQVRVAPPKRGGGPPRHRCGPLPPRGPLPILLVKSGFAPFPGRSYESAEPAWRRPLGPSSPCPRSADRLELPCREAARRRPDACRAASRAGVRPTCRGVGMEAGPQKQLDGLGVPLARRTVRDCPCGRIRPSREGRPATRGAPRCRATRFLDPIVGRELVEAVEDGEAQEVMGGRRRDRNERRRRSRRGCSRSPSRRKTTRVETRRRRQGEKMAGSLKARR